MEPDLAFLLPATAIWLAAGIVAERLPEVRTARALRRRTGWLGVLAIAGLVTLAVPILDALSSPGPAGPGQGFTSLGLPAAPAVVVAAVTVRRIRHLWTGTGTFASAPETPAAPALLAGAAHPLVAFPVQLTGLAALATAVTAVGLVPLTAPDMLGLALTGVVLAVVAIGVRHALRHSRLVELAVTACPSSPRAARVLHV